MPKRTLKPETVGTFTVEVISGPYLAPVRELVTFELAIDTPQLAGWMGVRAAHASKGVSKLQGGMIVARVTGRRPLASPAVEPAAQEGGAA